MFRVESGALAGKSLNTGPPPPLGPRPRSGGGPVLHFGLEVGYENSVQYSEHDNPKMREPIDEAGEIHADEGWRQRGL